MRPDRTTARITGRRLYAVGFVASAAVVLSLTACASGDAAPATPEHTDAATATRELRAAASAPSPTAVASTPSASPTVPQPTAAPTVAPPPPPPPAPAAAIPPAATATPYVAVPPPPAPPAAPAAPADLPAPRALEGIRIWSDGDSTSYFMSAALLDMAAGLGAVPVQAAPDYKVSSGLMNPALFDWPAYISGQFDALQPAVAVFMIGANDASSSLPYDVYHQRVGALMDLMRAPFRRVIWVGQPHMGRPDLEPVIPDMNQIFQQEASARPWVTYVDIYGITSAADGSYSAYLPDENGVVQLMRASDGVHFTSAGGRLLAGRVLQAILTGR